MNHRSTLVALVALATLGSISTTVQADPTEERPPQAEREATARAELQRLLEEYDQQPPRTPTTETAPTETAPTKSKPKVKALEGPDETTILRQEVMRLREVNQELQAQIQELYTLCPAPISFPVLPQHNTAPHQSTPHMSTPHMGPHP